MKFYIHTTTYFFQVKLSPKVTNIHLYINKKTKKTKKFLKSTYHIAPHGSPMCFHMHNKVTKTFHINYHVKVNAP
jgi:hypothetical protein